MIIEFLPDYVLKIDFRCHLAYRSAACWTHRKGEIIIEVYYVGSREKAPY